MSNNTVQSLEINSKAKDVKATTQLSVNTMLKSGLSQLLKGVSVQNFFMKTHT